MKKTTILLLILGSSVAHSALTNMPDQSRERGRDKSKESRESRESRETRESYDTRSFEDSYEPQAVPEASSPALLAGLASAVVLLNQRRRTP